MRKLLLTAMLVGVGFLASSTGTTAQAESLQVKHKPWAHMTTAQKIKTLKLQIHKDKCVIRFWKNHRELASATVVMGEKARVQTHWARVSLHIATKHLKSLLAYRGMTASSSVIHNLLCIHKWEGAWDDPGAPYWGGLQMDLTFQQTYGGYYLKHMGTADHWPPSVQLAVAAKAVASRGYSPWPNTARLCGLY